MTCLRRREILLVGGEDLSGLRVDGVGDALEAARTLVRRGVGELPRGTEGVSTELRNVVLGISQIAANEGSVL
jgi:hypothetical protein